jgi:hypothetical protein
MHISVSCPVLRDRAKTFIDILYVMSADWGGGEMMVQGRRGGGDIMVHRGRKDYHFVERKMTVWRREDDGIGGGGGGAGMRGREDDGSGR